MMAPALIEYGIIFEGVFFGVESTNTITLAPEELSEETLHNWSGGTNQMNHTSKARPIRPKKPPTAPPTTAPRSSAMLLWLPWLLLLPSPPPPEDVGTVDHVGGIVDVLVTNVTTTEPPGRVEETCETTRETETEDCDSGA